MTLVAPILLLLAVDAACVEDEIAYSITLPGGNNNIYVIGADGNDRRQVTDTTIRDCGPAWSPDGQRIAFYVFYDMSIWSVFTMNSDGSDRQRLTNRPGYWDHTPRWSLDGTRIVFCGEHDETSELWLINADGTGISRLGDVLGGGPDWSPVGDEIVYHSLPDYNDVNTTEICVVKPDGSDWRRLTNKGFQDLWPTWSPDGAQIAFSSDRDGNREIYVMDADGGNVRRLTDNPASETTPDWSPDGSRLVFVSDRDGNYELYTVNADGSDETRLTHTSVHAIQPAWRPGGGGVPVFLVDFHVEQRSDGVVLTWLTNGDAEPGDFRVEVGRGDDSWRLDAYSPAPGRFEAIDTRIADFADGTVVYRLFLRGESREFAQIAERRMQIRPLQTGARIKGVRPNPFNPQTTVAFTVDRPCDVGIGVFDLRGRRIAELAAQGYG